MSGAGLASPRQERFVGGGEGIYGQAEGDRGKYGRREGDRYGYEEGDSCKNIHKTCDYEMFCVTLRTKVCRIVEHRRCPTV